MFNFISSGLSDLLYMYWLLMSLYLSIYNWFVYYYMLSKQKGYNMYIYLIVILFGFRNLIVQTNNQKVPLASLRFLLYLGITKFINLMYRLRTKVDINADKVHITKLTQENEQAIIIDRDMFDDDKDFITFEDIIVKLNLVQMDGTMTNIMIVNLDLVNNDEKVCLKNFMFKYKDTDERYHHTLKNIFIFNNIDHNDNSVINIKMFKNKKLVTQTIPLKDILDKHINHLIKSPLDR